MVTGMRSALRQATRTGRVLEAKKLAYRLLHPTPPSWHLRDQRDIELIRCLISWSLSPAGHAVDVGAHKGGFLRDMLRVAPDGRHLAIEALPHLAAELRSRYPEAQVVNAAASDSVGQVSFTHVANLPALSGLREQPWEAELEARVITVPSVTVDSIVEEKARVELIKVDVEGAELQVLQGAEETLRHGRPLVVFEFAARTADVYGTSAESMHEFLASLDYRLFDIEGRGPLTTAQFSEVVATAQLWNFVAH